MRKTSWILTATLILSFLATPLALASERDSYAERSREWVNVEELERLIEEQMESIGPWIEEEVQPRALEEIALLMEELGPMMEEIQIEVQESLHENMVDVREILRESLSEYRIDSRIRVERYESREDRIRDEIDRLEERLERLREQLEETDEKF